MDLNREKYQDTVLQLKLSHVALIVLLFTVLPINQQYSYKNQSMSLPLTCVLPHVEVEKKKKHLSMTAKKGHLSISTDVNIHDQNAQSHEYWRHSNTPPLGT